jgi:hypothetical protein
MALAGNYLHVLFEFPPKLLGAILGHPVLQATPAIEQPGSRKKPKSCGNKLKTITFLEYL